MRRHTLLFLIALCLHIAARGQTVVSLDDVDLSHLPQPTEAKALRYWFDDGDNSSVQTTSMLSGTHVIDVSALTEGFHSLHYQVIDTHDAVAYIGSGILMKAPSVSGLAVKSMRYWYDDDAASVQTAGGITGTYVLDVSRLADGLHTLHYQLMGEGGTAGYVGTALFVHTGSSIGTTTVRVQKLMYWYDDDTTTHVADMSGATLLVDASGLTSGLHTIHYQAQCTNGLMTPARSSFFMLLNSGSEGGEAKVLRYWFDDAPTAEVVAISEGPQLLDASALSDGLHTVHYQLIDEQGMAAVPCSALFMKMDIGDDATTAKQLRYWFDDATTATVTTVAGGTQTLDVAALPTGLHTLNYQLVDNKGRAGTPYTRIFLKTFDRVLPEGHNRVTKYQYWLNEKSAAMQTVELDKAANPYTLIALLPMEKEPIRSAQFHFAMTDDQPTIYAKNTLHVRFWDAQGYFTDGDKPFVDYSVKQEVTDVTPLESGVRETTDRPQANEIKWFQVEAERGDSLQFRLDCAASLQLYAPSGKEVFGAIGSESVKWGGLYADESGTYYLALHDVTAAQSKTVSIDYNHIDKYAVLHFTPDTIGIYESFVDITIDGNGFDKLTDVTLRKGNSRIAADSIEIYSKSMMKAKYTFYGNEDEGDYDMVLRFADNGVADSIIVKESVRLEELKMGDVVIKVTPSRKLQSPYPVTISVTNTGNVGMLYVPFNIATTFNLTFSSGPSKWASMETLNFSIDPGNTLGYNPFTTSFNLFGTGIPGMVVHMFIPRLGPHETKDYIIGFVGSSHAMFNLYAWTGIPLNAGYLDGKEENNIYSVWKYFDNFQEGVQQSRKMRKAAPNYNGLGDGLDAARSIDRTGAANAAGVAVGNGLAIGGLINGMHLRHNEILAQDDDFAQQVLEEDFNPRLRHYMPTPGVIGDVSGMPGWLQGLLGLQNRQAQCPTPMPDATPIEILNPGDPNDIFGYTAESGSKYMKEGTTDVYYTIEFENDPEIANASAHTIVVRDTLDTSRFDLSTFAATNVKIGDVEMELEGVKNFSKWTMDLRPAVDVIAQVSLSLDEQKGIATWTIESLDPMSMEPTEDAMQGVLPVNYNGKGQGELTFDIKLKPGMTEGEHVSNRAGIVFDQEGTIVTPTWTNIVDATLPESRIAEVVMATDTTVYVKVDTYDELSKPWKYDVYVQENADGTWQRKAVSIPVDSLAQVRVEEGISYGFYTVVTDSAGNVEQKEAAREFSFEVFAPQVDTNTRIELAEGWNWMSHNQQEPLLIAGLQTPAASRMVGQDEELYEDTRLGWVGDLTELLPTQMYKLQMDEPRTIQLSGRLFNATFRSIPLYQGWNWLGYPAAHTMTPAEALAKLAADEGDMLIGQDGMATYSDGQWTGTLQEMQPGQGFMYRSQTDKNLFLNTTAQASARKVGAQPTVPGSNLPEGWTVDKRRYPNVMGVVAQLWHGNVPAEQDDWVLAAFSGDGECRGIAQPIGDVLMMNVYGTGGEPIVFAAQNSQTGEVLAVEELEEFRADVVGTLGQPLPLHIGAATGIAGSSLDTLVNNRYFDLQGRKVDAAHMRKGIYIATDGAKTKTQKVVKQ